MWVATQKLPRSPGHPFCKRLNRVLEKAGFDTFVEGLCARVYDDGIGRPSLRPGRQDHEAEGRAEPSGVQGGRGSGLGERGGGGSNGAGGVGEPPDPGRNIANGAGGSVDSRVGRGRPGRGGRQEVSQQRNGAGVEGSGNSGVSVGNGSGPAQLEGEEPEVSGARVRESETDSRPPGRTVGAVPVRVGGAAVRT